MFEYRRDINHTRQVAPPVRVAQMYHRVGHQPSRQPAWWAWLVRERCSRVVAGAGHSMSHCSKVCWSSLHFGHFGSTEGTMTCRYDCSRLPWSEWSCATVLTSSFRLEISTVPSLAVLVVYSLGSTMSGCCAVSLISCFTAVTALDRVIRCGGSSSTAAACLACWSTSSLPSIPQCLAPTECEYPLVTVGWDWWCQQLSRRRWQLHTARTGC